MAMTGFYRTLRRPRAHRPLSMMKYDPVGMLGFLYFFFLHEWSGLERTGLVGKRGEEGRGRKISSTPHRTSKANLPYQPWKAGSKDSRALNYTQWLWTRVLEARCHCSSNYSPARISPSADQGHNQGREERLRYCSRGTIKNPKKDEISTGSAGRAPPTSVFRTYSTRPYPLTTLSST